MWYVEASPDVVKLQQGPRPEIFPGTARVKVLACGICGTDISAVKGMVLPKGAHYPVRLGHEVAGVVTEIEGDGLGISVGDLVALHPLGACDQCEACLAGEEQRCPHITTLGFSAPGGMAEEVVWPVSRMVTVKGLTPAEACLLPDAVATAHHALELAALPPGGSLCVIGAGGVGTHVIELARVLDPDLRLAAVVRRETTAQRVEQRGAYAVIGLEEAGGMVRKEIGSVDAVIDFSGVGAATAQAVRMLKRGGTLVLGSVIDDPLGVGTTMTGVVARELVIRGVYASGMRNLREVTALATGGRLSLADSVSHRFPLRDAPEAFRLVRERSGDLVRVVLEP